MTNIEALLQSLQVIREQRFAREDEEYQQGVQAIAVPIIISNTIVAAISVLIPTVHVQPGPIETLVEQVQGCARFIVEHL